MNTFLAIHNVTSGCNKLFPRDITSHLGYEKHGVRCCDNIGTTCITPKPCQLASTYHEAKNICSEQGLRLCKRNEKLRDICCEKGCNMDSETMWIADDRTGNVRMRLGKKRNCKQI